VVGKLDFIMSYCAFNPNRLGMDFPRTSSCTIGAEKGAVIVIVVV